jgi:outer membrane protein assembly factor BamB
LRRQPLLVLLAAAAAACGARTRLGPPPTLFPIETRWTAPVDGIVQGPLASDGNLLFVSTRDGALRALDRGSGAVVWQASQRAGTLAAAPAMLVLRQPDGSVLRLEPANGEVRWKAETGVTGLLPAVIDGQIVLVAGNGLAALDAVSGRTLWSVPDSPEASSPPVASGGFVLLGEADGTLRCRDLSTGAAVWAYRTPRALVAPPLVDASRRVLLGTTDRRFVSLRLAKGRQRWRWRLGADVQTPAALLADRVVFATHEDVLYALKRSNGNMAWRAPLPSRPVSGPLLVGSAVLVACYESDVVGFDGRTGRRVGALKLGAELLTPPLLIGDRLYVGLRDRTVVALDPAFLRPAPSPTPTPPPAPAPVATPTPRPTPQPVP